MNYRTKFFFPLLFFVVIVCAILEETGCKKREIPIGVILPMTGIRRYFGEVMKHGVDLAVEDMNRQGLMNGKLVCYYEDDESDPEKSKQAAERLIRKKNVLALIGSYSNLNTLTIAKVAECMETPLISPTSAAEAISTSGYKWVFRLNAPSSYYALTIMDFLNNILRVRRIALLHENDDFGVRTTQYIQKYAKDMKGTIIVCCGYDTQTNNFIPLVKAIKAKNPDALLLISHIDDGISIMRASHAVKLDVKAYTGCGAGFCHRDFIEKGKKDVEYFFTVTQWSDQVEWQGSRLFTEHYKERFGVEPGYHSAETYSAVQVLAACFKKKGINNRRNLREALLTLNTETIFGPIRFENFQDYSNQNSHSLLIQQVQGGRFILVWPKEYQKGSILYPTPPWDKRK